MSVIKPFVVGLLLVAGGYLLERGGVFLYTGYLLVRILAILAALGLGLWTLLLWKGRGIAPSLVAAGTCCILVLLAWHLESHVTSPRKGFYLASSKVKEGMLFSDAERLMAPYRIFSVAPGHASFAFRSSAQTEDVLVVHYDPETARVTTADLSLD